MSLNYVIVRVDDPSKLDRLNGLRLILKLESKDQIDTECRIWLIADARKNMDLGYINVVSIDGREKEIGFALVSEARRKGIMSEVLPPFVEQLKELLYSETSDRNIAAIRVLEKSGFQPCEPYHFTHITPYGETVQTLAFRYSP